VDDGVCPRSVLDNTSSYVIYIWVVEERILLMEKIRYKTNGGILSIRIVKENLHTVWVELPDGNIIKRHKRKHVA